MTQNHQRARAPDASPPGLWSRCLEADHAAFVGAAKMYWYPVYAWLRRCGLKPVRAADGVKTVVTLWATFEPPRAADPRSGMMRTWLLDRIALMVTRGIKPGTKSVIEIDLEKAEERYALEPICDADAVFQHAWAVSVMEAAVSVTRREYGESGCAASFAELVTFSGTSGASAMYERLASRLRMHPRDARTAAAVFCVRLRDALHTVVSDTMVDAEVVESEIRFLQVSAGEHGMGGEDIAGLPFLGGAKAHELYARALTATRSHWGGAWQWTPPGIEEVAALFKNYDSFDVLGYGGMGAVFKARQVALDREVAIKLLPIEVSAEQAFAERFVREARAMAKLSHPNIVGVHEFGQTSAGHLFFVMDFVDGENLYHAIHHTGIVPSEVLRVIGRVCDALAYAHGKGIVHRDIKPANIILGTNGEVKVADFGLARLSDKVAAPGEPQATVTGFIMGTPDYIAPEQTQEMDVDHRADIYSLGVVLYEALVGEVPRGVFDPPSQRVNVDPRLDHIVGRAIHRQPDRRFQSAEEMKSAIESLDRRPVPTARAVAKAVVAIPVPRATAPLRGVAKKRRGTLVFAAVLATLALIAAAHFLNGNNSLTHAERSLLVGGKVPKKQPNSPTRVETSPVAPEKPRTIKDSPPSPEPHREPVSPAPEKVSVSPGQPDRPVAQADPVAQKSNVDPEVVKWLAEQATEYTARWKAEAIEPYEAARARLREEYTANLDKRYAAASRVGRTSDALAFRDERDRSRANEPLQDLPYDSPGALLQAQDAYKASLEKLDGLRFARAKVVHQQFDALLEKGQIGYTQRQRLDDATLLQNMREEITRDWLTPPIGFTHSQNPSPSLEKPAIAQRAARISEREAIERLLEFDSRIVVESGRSRLTITNAVEIPAGRISIREIHVTGGAKRGSPATGGGGNGGTKAAGAMITDGEFAGFPAMRELQVCEIAGGDFTGAGLAFLSGSPDLVRVVVRSPSLADAVLDPLVALRKIRVLEIRGNNGKGKKGGMSLSRFAEFASWTDLERLVVVDGSFAAENLPGVERARSLLELELTIPAMSDEFVAGIGKLQKLTQLHLSGVVKFPKDGLKLVEKCPNLTELRYWDSPCFIGQLEPISRMRKLESLKLDAVDAPGLAAAAAAPALRSISFSDFRSGTDESLMAIASNFPRLERLVVSATDHRFTSAGIKSLSGLQRLQSLVWHAPGLNDATVAIIAGFPALRELELGSAKWDDRISDSQLTELAKLKNLERLTVADMSVTPTIVDALKKLRPLKELIIVSKVVSDADLAALRRAMAKCQVTKR